MKGSSISVVYLCWIPYGLNCFDDFLNSYQKFQAGITHKLIIVFKGYTNSDEKKPFLDTIKRYSISFEQLDCTDGGLDISTYYWSARQLDSENVMFLNTRSRVLSRNWLLHFYESSKLNPLYIFSATGSWQSYASSIFALNSTTYERKKSILQNFNKYKLLIKAATLWWVYFPLYPNPHIRTNAFFINRKLFLSLQIKKIVSKIDAYRFESGRNGFTNQLKKLGYKVALVDASGKVYFSESWRDSEIFWKNEQKNLLISDNQTELYMNANTKDKMMLEKLAWG